MGNRTGGGFMIRAGGKENKYGIRKSGSDQKPPRGGQADATDDSVKFFYGEREEIKDV